MNNGLVRQDIGVALCRRQHRNTTANGEVVEGGARKQRDVDEVNAVCRHRYRLDLRGVDGKIHKTARGVVKVQVGIGAGGIRYEQGNALALKQLDAIKILDIACHQRASFGAAAGLVQVATDGGRVGQWLGVVDAVVGGAGVERVIGGEIQRLAGAGIETTTDREAGGVRRGLHSDRYGAGTYVPVVVCHPQ